MSNAAVKLLANHLQAVFDEDKGVFADSLSKAIGGVNGAQAGWRPKGGERTIGEVVNHVAYWKQVVLKQLDGKSTLAGPTEDWAPVKTEAQWKSALSQLNALQAELVQRAQKLSDADLGKKPEGGGWPAWGEVLLGTAAHDLYHTGQIIQLRQLQGI